MIPAAYRFSPLSLLRVWLARVSVSGALFLCLGLPALAPGEAYSQSAYSNPLPTPSPFNRVFKLWTTPGVRDSLNGGWTRAQIDTFARTILDAPGTGSPQVFETVWDYFCHGDSAAARDSVHFRAGAPRYDHIQVFLYDQADFDCPGGPYIECRCFGGYTGGNKFMIWQDCSGKSPRSPAEAAGRQFAHELQHLADKANGHRSLGAGSELMSTAAEWKVGERWRTGFDDYSGEYDVSLMGPHPDNFKCGSSETPCKYNQYRLFQAYLFTHFSGAADSLDLVYRWIRSGDGQGSTASFRDLGRVLMEAPFDTMLAGESPGEKAGTLYHRFALARYADDPDFGQGTFGFGEVSARSFGLFEWRDPEFPRKRVIPPVILVTDAGDHVLREWTDPVEPGLGTEPFRVLTTSSDYLVFLADTLDTHTGGDLRIRIRGTEPIPENQNLRIGALLYDAADPALFQHRLQDAVESYAVNVRADTLDTEVVIPGFGGDIRGAVLVISMVERDPSPFFESPGLVKSMDYEILYSRND